MDCEEVASVVNCDYGERKKNCSIEKILAFISILEMFPNIYIYINTKLTLIT
jgi:hypothetical protein